VNHRHRGRVIAVPRRLLTCDRHNESNCHTFSLFSAMQNTKHAQANKTQANQRKEAKSFIDKINGTKIQIHIDCMSSISVIASLLTPSTM
jgi:hypothetical protein